MLRLIFFYLYFLVMRFFFFFFFFSSRRRHTRLTCDWNSDVCSSDLDDASLRKRLAIPSDRRLWDLFRAIDRGWSLDQIHELTKIDPWFLRQFSEISAMRQAAVKSRSEERRVGKEWRSRGAPHQLKKK